MLPTHSTFVLALACLVPSSAAAILARILPGTPRYTVRSELHPIHIILRPLYPPHTRPIPPHSWNIHRRLPTLSLPSSRQVPRACTCPSLPALGTAPCERWPSAPRLARTLRKVRRGRQDRAGPPHHVQCKRRTNRSGSKEPVAEEPECVLVSYTVF
jgi:hypothetical protein